MQFEVTFWGVFSERKDFSRICGQSFLVLSSCAEQKAVFLKTALIPSLKVLCGLYLACSCISGWFWLIISLNG